MVELHILICCGVVAWIIWAVVEINRLQYIIDQYDREIEIPKIAS